MGTLKQVLYSLGTTADEVAEACRAAGVKGRSDDLRDCPIARLLVSRGLRNVRVTTHSSSCAVVPLESPMSFSMDRCADPYPSSCLNPYPVVKFIARFDRGQYPDLLELFRVDAIDPK